MTAPNPSGCQHCGVDQQEHMQRWISGIGWHTWTKPTDQQIKERMRARRNQRKEST